MDKWISVFEASRKIMNDSGRELQNESMEEMFEMFDIRLLATAVESL